MADILLRDFFEQVGIDYETDLSTQGEIDGERFGKCYAKLINQYPELFPDVICISPYLRTRRTAHYFLKDVEGLDIDMDQLINEEKLEDLIIGSFKGKEVCIKIEERIRERDFGSNIAPSYLRDFYGETKGNELLTKLQKDKMYYFTAPVGGESQIQDNARVKDFLNSMRARKEYNNVLAFTHHLTMISALLSVF